MPLLDSQPDAADSPLARFPGMAPGQNLWYLRRGINHLEDAFGDVLDLPGESNEERAERLAANQ